jgi:hypothetical protein
MRLPSDATSFQARAWNTSRDRNGSCGCFGSLQNADYVAVALPDRIGADIGADGLVILSCSMSRSLKVSRLMFGFHDGATAPVAVAANGLGGGAP